MILWRRLDVPGHDACRLSRLDAGWQLAGTAVFFEQRPTLLAYSVICDAEWRAISGSVTGWSGEQQVDVRFERTHGRWLMNGEHASAVDDCLDLDFGFTPATNLFQIRRLNLAISERGDAPAAWFDLSTPELVRLPQIYERRTERSYWYESPTADYTAELQMSEAGFASVYPGLWQEVAE
ncbi:MAG TPA: putative glycolipid-binding domain-containing protein [Thermoanaerobaculia bacterium]